MSVIQAWWVRLRLGRLSSLLKMSGAIAGLPSSVFTGNRRTLVALASVLPYLFIFGSPETLYAQASLFFGSQRPFVIGIQPVVGNGAVGGVSVDAGGVLATARTDSVQKLRKAREAALDELPGELDRPCELRKISLRRLEAAILANREKETPLPDEILNLAGLQRIRYVFAYPEQNDVVLAGFAEGWRVDNGGNLIGRTSGRPVQQLGDLVVALRTAESAAETGISCSIDPTREGLEQLRRLLASPGLKMNRATLLAMEHRLGQQTITIGGVPPTSRFARVMVGADFLMKRLAMNFEKSPVKGMPSYLTLLKGTDGPLPANMMPRWWLAPRYDPLLVSPDRLAWELRGVGVQAMTEESFLNQFGEVAPTGRENSVAQKWADSFTENYEQLAAELPVYGELQNLIDLAVVSALIFKEDLPGATGYNLPVLLTPKVLTSAEYHVPQTVDSAASFVKRGNQYLISVSGGVQIGSWAVADRTTESDEPAAVRASGVGPNAGHWWWD